MAHTRPRGFLKDTLTHHPGLFWVSTVLLSKWNGTCAQGAPGRHYLKLFWTHIALTLKNQIAHTRPRGAYVPPVGTEALLLKWHIRALGGRAIKPLSQRYVLYASKTALSRVLRCLSEQMAHTRPRGVLIDTLKLYLKLFWTHIALTLKWSNGTYAP